MLINNVFWTPLPSKKVPMKSPLVIAVGRLVDRSVGSGLIGRSVITFFSKWLIRFSETAPEVG